MFMKRIGDNESITVLLRVGVREKFYCRECDCKEVRISPSSSQDKACHFIMMRKKMMNS